MTRTGLDATTEFAYLTHFPSGETYAAELFPDGTVVAISRPLHHADVAANPDPSDIEGMTAVDADWANAQQWTRK